MSVPIATPPAPYPPTPHAPTTVAPRQLHISHLHPVHTPAPKHFVLAHTGTHIDTLFAVLAVLAAAVGVILVIRSFKRLP